MPTENPGAILHLTAAGVSVLIDATDGQLPAIVHWGRAVARVHRRRGPDHGGSQYSCHRFQHHRYTTAARTPARAGFRLAGTSRTTRFI